MNDTHRQIKDNPESVDLGYGLVGIKTGNIFKVVDEDYGLPDAGPLCFAFGDSLKEAEATYWKRQLEAAGSEIVPAIQEATTVSQTVKTLREAWETANAELLLADIAARSRVAMLEELMKRAAVVVSTVTGDNQPHEFVKVVEKSGGLTYDLAKAKEWAKTNFPAALTEQLDVKAFESFSGVTALDFVTENEKIPTAQIQRKKIEDAK